MGIVYPTAAFMFTLWAGYALLLLDLISQAAFRNAVLVALLVGFIFSLWKTAGWLRNADDAALLSGYGDALNWLHAHQMGFRLPDLFGPGPREIMDTLSAPKPEGPTVLDVLEGMESPETKEVVPPSEPHPT